MKIKGGMITMSRAVRPDFEFNKERFTELLIKARGQLTLTDYANKCGVSLSYMCKYLKGKFDKAPTPSTIKKIARFTETNGITEEELLEAAGYSVAKYSDSNTARNFAIRFEKLGIATITSALTECNFKWNVKQPTHSPLFDLSIEIDDDDITEWIFDFKTRINDREPTFPLRQRMYMYYGYFICTQHTTTSKISLVTNSEVLFNDIKMINPHLLPMYASVILINTDDMKVVKEEYLETYIPISNDIKAKYTLK